MKISLTNRHISLMLKQLSRSSWRPPEHPYAAFPSPPTIKDHISNNIHLSFKSSRTSTREFATLDEIEAGFEQNAV